MNRHNFKAYKLTLLKNIPRTQTGNASNNATDIINKHARKSHFVKPQLNLINDCLSEVRGSIE